MVVFVDFPGSAVSKQKTSARSAIFGEPLRIGQSEHGGRRKLGSISPAVGCNFRPTSSQRAHALGTVGTITPKILKTCGEIDIVATDTAFDKDSGDLGGEATASDFTCFQNHSRQSGRKR